MQIIALVLCSAAIVLNPAQRRQPPAPMPEVDVTTGRDLRVYAPDRLVDYGHMKLELRFERLEDRAFTAKQTMTVRPIGVPVRGLRLDAPGLAIGAVADGDGKPIEWSHDGSSLFLHFPAPLGDAWTTIVTTYTCTDPIDGMTFTPAGPDPKAYPAEVHTQGQPESNRFWFPCHDFPNERMTTELVIDVPAGVSASGNGKLVAHAVANGRETWHWLQDKPHVSYLVSLVAGTFERTALPNPRSGVPMQVWALPGHADEVHRTYDRTDEMIEVLAGRFGTPYPWARYDQLIVRNFGAGGMENTSVTSLLPGAWLSEAAARDGDYDGLIAHELGHQWTGDYITCTSWDHLWLNEGWATYCENLWFERRDGVDGYFDEVLDNARVARRDRVDVPHEAMCSKCWRDPGETFSRLANPYPKGASILHMLREMLGDRVFFAGVQSYMKRFGLQTVETDDFRKCMEEASGLSLEWFFDQWCMRPGTPELKVVPAWDGATRTLTVTVDQVQTIDEKRPAFRFTLPILVRTAGSERLLAIDVRERSASRSWELDGPPVLVAVDPRVTVLKTATIEMPTAWWLEQAKVGPNSACRRQAIQALGSRDEPGVASALDAIVRDPARRWTERQDAVEALWSLGSPASREIAMQVLADFRGVPANVDAAQAASDPRVRRAVIERLSQDKDPAAVAHAIDLVRRDGSPACKAAAIGALAAMKERWGDQGDAARAVLVDALAIDSSGEKVRSAALDALADIPVPAALPSIRKLAALGNLDRMRPSAIRALAANLPPTEQQAERDAVIAELVAMIDDREERAARTAASQCARLKLTEARERLERMAGSDRRPSMRESAKGWLKEIG